MQGLVQWGKQVLLLITATQSVVPSNSTGGDRPSTGNAKCWAGPQTYWTRVSRLARAPGDSHSDWSLKGTKLNLLKTTLKCGEIFDTSSWHTRLLENIFKHTTKRVLDISTAPKSYRRPFSRIHLPLPAKDFPSLKIPVSWKMIHVDHCYTFRVPGIVLTELGCGDKAISST